MGVGYLCLTISGQLSRARPLLRCVGSWLSKRQQLAVLRTLLRYRSKMHQPRLAMAAPFSAPSGIGQSHTSVVTF